MGYDLMVFDPKAAPRGEEAFLRWCDEQTQWPEGQSYEDPSATTPNLAVLYADMCLDFPDMSAPYATDPANDKDNPRVTGYTIGQSTIYTDFRWSEAETAYTIVRSLAVKHRVGFFNVSAGDYEVWFPPSERTSDRAAIPGLLLTLEGQQAFHTPSVALIEAAVDWLRPAGGPGFLLLETEEIGDYAQVGGGQGAFTVEWRRHSYNGFRHRVAGQLGGDSEREIKIPGNGQDFAVNANERLSNASVKDILGAFARGEAPPREFVWRDITAQFKSNSSSDTSKAWWKIWR